MSNYNPIATKLIILTVISVLRVGIAEQCIKNCSTNQESSIKINKETSTIEIALSVDAYLLAMAIIGLVMDVTFLPGFTDWFQFNDTRSDTEIIYPDSPCKGNTVEQFNTVGDEKKPRQTKEKRLDYLTKTLAEIKEM